jgi:pyroglutamyl-peptidase
MHRSNGVFDIGVAWMPRVLITAFGPYGTWKENASWLAMIELTRNLPKVPDVTTRLYPVDFDVVHERLEQDLSAGYDYVLHLGQAPGASCIQLEAIGINVSATTVTDPDQPHPLIPDGPVAYQSVLPLAHWAGLLRDAGIPARVSYHAGTYLCNAILYLTHYLCQRREINTRATFVHLPLSCAQALTGEQELPSVPSSVAAEALRLILDQLADEATG